MKAIWGDQVIAETPNESIIHIEGNAYFPPNSIKKQFFQPSSTNTICFWKGKASYYHIAVNGQMNQDAAWYYPNPIPASLDRVKKDFTNYIAFWRGVRVES